MKPNRWEMPLSWVLMILFLFLLGVGCASDEKKKAKHFKRAKQYIEKNELKKAVIELKNVIQIDPKDDAAFFGSLGD